MGWFSEDSHTCSECCYLDICNVIDNMYWCEKRKERVSACSVACSYFTKAYKRDDKISESLRKNTNESSSGCFITTIVVNTLGYSDNVSYLKTLRYFRDNVLQKSEKFKNILATYDVIGPIISKKIENDKNKNQICLNLFDLCIKKVCKLIELNKEDEAIDLYKNMTNLLIEGYNIKQSINDNYLNNMDIKNSGHGKIAILKETL